MKKFIYFLSIFFITGFAALILNNPNPCIRATAYALNLCARVLIPSLYPFTFCVLFILNSGIFEYIKLSGKTVKKLFGMDLGLFTVFLISLIGGYPLGAKLINESYADKKTAGIMINYCVNAGPAFIVTAIGNGIFHSKEIGILLFTAHIIPSFILAFLYRKRLTTNSSAPQKHISISDNFILSASSAASALISICTFVILFSIITAYFNKFSFLKPFTMLLEVTNSVSQSDNILLISALLGFSGISVWCQIYSISKKAKPNILSFALCRIFHALISVFLSFIGIKLFGITVPTLSNKKVFSYEAFANTSAVGISLIILALLLMISLRQKNYTGNILEDIV